MELRHIKIQKNSFEDAFLIMAVLFTVTIFILILAKSWTEIKTPLNEGLSSAMPSDSSVNITETIDQTTGTISLFDKLLPFLLIGLFGFIMIGASMMGDHPILLFIGIVIVAVAILLGVIYANVYQGISETDEFTDTADDFSISSIFMEYLPFIMFLSFIAVGVVIVWLRKGGASAGL